jgi:Tol biopolymer transport system component
MTRTDFRYLRIFWITLCATFFSACGNLAVGVETPAISSGDNVTKAETTVVVSTPTSLPTESETPQPTPLPVDPTAGLVYTTAEGLWRIAANGEAELLVNQPFARLSPDGKTVVYERNDDSEGGNDIWLVDLTNGEQRNLTHTPDLFEVGPEFWPGRSDAVVFGTGEEPGMGNRNLPTIINLDGSGYKIIDLDDGGSRVMSPDGEMIAYNGYDPTGKIYRWNESPELFNPAQYGINVKTLVFLAFSPDSRYLAAKVIGDLTNDGRTRFGFTIFDLETKTSRSIHIYDPQGGGMVPDYFSWSPDGQWIAFVTFNEPPGTGRQPNLWVMPANSTDEQYISQGLNPMWSPDSSRLAFINTGSDNLQHLWISETGDWQTVDLELTTTSMVNFLVGWFSP